MTLTGADGTYWLSITEDTWTDFAQWTRVYGTHYCWRPSASQPADIDALLCFVSCTVAGGAITAVTPIASRSTLAAAWRGLLALGTLATQNANAVAITGGSATGLSVLGTEGTFVAAATGFAAVSGTAFYTVLGRTVVLDLPDLVGTSNATLFSILGLPAAVSCPRLTRWPVLVQDNGVFQIGILQINGTTIDVYSTPGFGGWTASGTKALYAPTLTYLLQT